MESTKQTSDMSTLVFDQKLFDSFQDLKFELSSRNNISENHQNYFQNIPNCDSDSHLQGNSELHRVITSDTKTTQMTEAIRINQMNNSQLIYCNELEEQRKSVKIRSHSRIKRINSSSELNENVIPVMDQYFSINNQLNSDMLKITLITSDTKTTQMTEAIRINQMNNSQLIYCNELEEPRKSVNIRSHSRIKRINSSSELNENVIPVTDQYFSIKNQLNSDMLRITPNSDMLSNSQENSELHRVITSDPKTTQMTEAIRINQMNNSQLIYCKELEEPRKSVNIRSHSRIKRINSSSELNENVIPVTDQYFSIKNQLNSDMLRIIPNSDMLSNLNLKACHFFDSNQSCVHFIYINYIYSLFNKKKFSNDQSKNDFIKFCEENYSKYYGKECDLEILTKDCNSNDFEDKIITWFTEETFFYRMINNVFRTDDYYSLFKLRYAINLLNKQLNSIIMNEEEIPHTLYRGSIIEKTEFQVLKSNVGKSIILRGFISSSSNLSIAEQFANSNLNDHTKFYPVVFVINVDKNKDLNKIHPIFQYNTSRDEYEFLFSNNTFLKINEIEDTLIVKGYFTINCSLSDFEDNYAKFNPITLDYMKSLEKLKEEKYEQNKKNDNFYMLSINRILKNNDLSLKILRDIKNEDELNATDDYLYSCYGKVYYEKGDYEKALQYLQQSLKIRLIKRFGEYHPDTLNSYNAIGLVYYKKGEYEKALQYMEKSLKIRLERFGNKDSKIATCNNNIGLVYYKKGEYDKAIYYMEKSLKIRLERFGNKDSKIATCNNNIGLVYYKKGDYEKALEYHKESLKIRLSIFGEIHPDTAESLENLGSVYSEEYYKNLENPEASLDIELEIFEENNPDTTESNNIIESVCSEEKENYITSENIEDYCQLSLATLESNSKDTSSNFSNSQDTSSNFSNIESIYYNEKLYKKALGYIKKSLKIKLAYLGENHPECADSYHKLGIFYFKHRKYDYAIEFLVKSLKKRYIILGENHPDTLDTYESIVTVYIAKGGNEKAQDMNFYLNI